MAGVRVATTRDGRYVPDTDPDAVALAYSQHDDVPDDVVEKMRGKPQDKRRKGSARNKSADGTPAGDESSSG